MDGHLRPILLSRLKGVDLKIVSSLLPKHSQAKSGMRTNIVVIPLHMVPGKSWRQGTFVLTNDSTNNIYSL